MFQDFFIKSPTSFTIKISTPTPKNKRANKIR
ncbi:Uncharacterised protein [Weeksella virosa]|uniref:Uncharacterized protein n=1 Tax=Weeksella virosa (strain ATCC 43766 / DSM 16922 / JCM 21250 / CCUG 30538 / CDC 9751 / IAM 14551 / NBRC 16016 / NCTC 11634 / CL345/78) TaxID=865938 RepID=F0P299_WEEVC|nr:hypothetical protein Weevi_1080 [Weeksella virosa DSM 16922]SUP54089.1 Uncharacterised protein [Weeksella virosa]VEH64584.1 Uncharacterised protein [Weeksella virosa]